jgi:hypothetical protein
MVVRAFPVEAVAWTDVTDWLARGLGGAVVAEEDYAGRI